MMVLDVTVQLSGKMVQVLECFLWSKRRMQVLKDQSAAQCVSAVLQFFKVWHKVR